MRWAGHVALMGRMRNPYKMLVGIRARKRPLETRRRKLEYNIKNYLKEQNMKMWFRIGTNGRLL